MPLKLLDRAGVGVVAVTVAVLWVSGARRGAAQPTPSAPVGMDELVDRTCGSNPLERKIAGRLARAKLDDKSLAAFKDCWRAGGQVDLAMPIKALRGLDVKAEAALHKCLHKEKVNDPEVIGTLTGYVRAAFDGNESDRRMQSEYASCYADVLRCRQHPCPPAAPASQQRVRAAAAAPLRVSVRLLAAAGDARLVPIAVDTPLRSGDKVVFQVTTSRPAFVYIVQKTAAHGRLRVLFPDPLIAVSNPIQGTALRLPPRDHFVLDEETGRETVFVVASEHEQVDLASRIGAAGTDGEGMLGRALESVSRTGRQADGRPLAADGQDAVTRGLTLSARMAGSGSGASGPAATAQASPGDDTLVLQLGFAHLPRAAR
jgi:hypothetical protein